ncbi:hypothetical protein AB0K14_31945 [Actinosynnema sp. NPDC050801]|uniref:hypothetical protein n=1 Tax=unclassified Actinosynnema TaxID=2637065 RepID=UPI00340F73E1
MTTPEADRQPTTPPQPFAQPFAPPLAPPPFTSEPASGQAQQFPALQPPQPPQSQPAPPPARPSRAPVVVLIALAAVLAIATATFTVLYFGERADRDGVAATVVDRERSLADLRGQQEELDAALESNRSRQSTLSTENGLLSTCVEAAKGYFDLPPGRTPESSRLFEVMYDTCPLI